MSSNETQEPRYSPHEKEVIKPISTVPAGYVTSNAAIAAAMHKQPKAPRNAGSNVDKSLRNLLGRSSIAFHRVMRTGRGTANGLRLVVREVAHVALLRAEGVDIDDLRRLKDVAAFWDFSPGCELAYRNNTAARGAAVAVSDAERGASNAAGHGVPRDVDLADQEVEHTDINEGVLDMNEEHSLAMDAPTTGHEGSG